MLAFLLPFLGIGVRPALVALTLYAVLPVVRNTYTGLSEVSGEVIEAAQDAYRVLALSVHRNTALAMAGAVLQALSDDLLRPLGLMVMAFLWWVGINLLGLPEGAMLVLLVAVKFLAGISTPALQKHRSA